MLRDVERADRHVLRLLRLGLLGLGSVHAVLVILFLLALPVVLENVLLVLLRQSLLPARHTRGTLRIHLALCDGIVAVLTLRVVVEADAECLASRLSAFPLHVRRGLLVRSLLVRRRMEAKVKA